MIIRKNKQVRLAFPMVIREMMDLKMYVECMEEEEGFSVYKEGMNAENPSRTSVFKEFKSKSMHVRLWGEAWGPKLSEA